MRPDNTLPRSQKSSFNSFQKHRRLGLTLFLVTALLILATPALASLSFLLKWGSTGSADGQFLGPNGIAVDTTGDVYVSEGNGNRFQNFDSNGNFLLKAGIPGDVPGGFVSPSG